MAAAAAAQRSAEVAAPKAGCRPCRRGPGAERGGGAAVARGPLLRGATILTTITQRDVIDTVTTTSLLKSESLHRRTWWWHDDELQKM